MMENHENYEFCWDLGWGLCFFLTFVSLVCKAVMNSSGGL